MGWGAALGAIGGALIGAKSAKDDRNATREANLLNARGYTDARPYIQATYKGGQDALNAALAQGYYTGPTLAGFNNQMTTGLDSRFNLGNAGFANANNMMNVGAQFAGNADNLYQLAGRDTLADARRDALANYQPLLTAAMRGANRNLNEVQLPGLNLRAAGSGNSNNSRAGVAEGVLRRGNAELEADTATRITNNLMSDYVDNANNQFRNLSAANTTLGNVYNTGFNLGNSSTGLMTDVGKAYQADEQARLNDARANYEGARDFALGQYTDFNSGILGRAPMSPPGQSPNLYNPTAGAMSGAMAGFGFGNQYLQPFFNPTAAPATPYYASGQSAMGPYTGLNQL